MDAKDLKLLLQCVDVCAKNGLISVDAFIELGVAVQKTKEAILKLGESGVLVISIPAKPNPETEPEEG